MDLELTIKLSIPEYNSVENALWDVHRLYMSRSMRPGISKKTRDEHLAAAKIWKKFVLKIQAQVHPQLKG